MGKNIDDRIKVITEMEKILNEHGEIINELEKAVEKFRNHQEEYNRLSEYYSSEEYFKDLELDENGELPDDLARGVLSEDAVFNLFGENYNMAVEMLEIATEILKNH
ncbi:DUF4298 domain-containing protein [Peptoniphilus sp. MSJ-1]|uniref:DUF4298 domain-containing protein n=1 Tax=Peptoniphilus ovalis TaxID=2841503 RepID=A0ABS6FEM3_9FIRM|nr:DUF4298 domain-containing protein [Peptoniphilus ovalis]MBU5668631.1 DUF4298 domain-containing protein [Peptoniphilus ovalis]